MSDTITILTPNVTRGEAFRTLRPGMARRLATGTGSSLPRPFWRFFYETHDSLARFGAKSLLPRAPHHFHDDSELVEQGSHGELLAAGGLYTAWCRMQATNGAEADDGSIRQRLEVGFPRAAGRRS